jgi:hypothetical protein
MVKSFDPMTLRADPNNPAVRCFGPEPKQFLMAAFLLMECSAMPPN